MPAQQQTAKEGIQSIYDTVFHIQMASLAYEQYAYIRGWRQTIPYHYNKSLMSWSDIRISR